MLAQVSLVLRNKEPKGFGLAQIMLIPDMAQLFNGRKSLIDMLLIACLGEK